MSPYQSRQGTFWNVLHMCEVRFRTYADAPLKNIVGFEMYCVAESVNNSEGFSFVLTNLLYSEQLNTKNLSSNRHSWYIPVTQFALPLNKKNEKRHQH